MQFYKPLDFARQIGMSPENMWGILNYVVDVVAAEPDGKFVVMKDANKPILRVYSVPEDTFEDDDEGIDD